MSSIIVNNNTEINWRKQLKQVLHFRFSFEPRFSEVDRSLFLAPPLRATSCNVHYSGSIWQWKRDLEQVWRVTSTICLSILVSLVFLSREKNSYHNHRVLLLILWPQHATKRKHRSDSLLHAYAFHYCLIKFIVYIFFIFTDFTQYGLCTTFTLLYN
jgi:hypothetical protein